MSNEKPSNEKPLRPLASVRTYPTDKNNLVCLALSDTEGNETEFIVNPDGLNALLYPVLGLASKWTRELGEKVKSWSGPKNALPARHVELVMGRTASECAVRVFMGEIELTFIVPMDAVLQATTKLTQQNDKDSGASIH
ncbi:hypothetical protein [Candidatus Nitrotoga fabula]|uniref:Uncharacterized protein n=1 Tax=Candidatus Nitrotoga fabula TaxID=2182327 RepID=A0A2X0R3H6_9PROT|nr:hypothetical protein [Candidatus Nitrotoga fabula]CAE6695501.1 conserved hypothetical protein [Candidatus Nitrotoga fabula]SPS04442.1 protein of unknown function [Candidatus Nitrotoga fabula]